MISKIEKNGNILKNMKWVVMGVNFISFSSLQCIEIYTFTVPVNDVFMRICVLAAYFPAFLKLSSC